MSSKLNRRSCWLQLLPTVGTWFLSLNRHPWSEKHSNENHSNWTFVNPLIWKRAQQEDSINNCRNCIQWNWIRLMNKFVWSVSWAAIDTDHNSVSLNCSSGHLPFGLVGEGTRDSGHSSNQNDNCDSQHCNFYELHGDDLESWFVFMLRFHREHANLLQIIVAELRLQFILYRL